MARESDSIGIEAWATGSSHEDVESFVHAAAQPLTTIACYANGALHRLRAAPSVDPEVVLALQYIVAETERAAALLRGLHPSNATRSAELP